MLLFVEKGLSLGHHQLQTLLHQGSPLGSFVCLDTEEMLKSNKSSSARRAVDKVQEVDGQISRDQSTRKRLQTVEAMIYLHSWGQKPYLPSASKSLVVEHQRNPSLRPASVQLLYSLPLNQKGNLQYSPSAFPYFTLTTIKRTNAVVKLANNGCKKLQFLDIFFPWRLLYRNAV